MNGCLSDPDLDQLLHDDTDDLNPQQLQHLGDCLACSERLEQMSMSGHESLSSPPHSSRPVDAGGGWGQRVDRLKSLARTSSDAPVGTDDTTESIGHFRLLEKIGSGGMGVVFRAYDQKIERVVAVKVLSDELSEFDAELIGREATVCARVEHPNVIPVYSVEPHKGQTVLVMQYIAGSSLEEMIQSGGCRDARHVAEILAQIATGISAAHDQQVLHRDIKPANIMVDERSGVAKIGDFGLATFSIQSAASSNSGTPAYMSPECKKGRNPTEQSDIYSLGVTLFQALTRSLPAKISHEAALEVVASDLLAICEKATQHDPPDRYLNMAEFAADLRAWLRGEPIQARPESFLQQVKRRIRKEKKGLLVLALLMIVVSTFGWAMFGKNREIEQLTLQSLQQDQQLDRFRHEQRVKQNQLTAIKTELNRVENETTLARKQLQSKKTELEYQRGLLLSQTLKLAVQRPLKPTPTLFTDIMVEAGNSLLRTFDYQVRVFEDRVEAGVADVGLPGLNSFGILNKRSALLLCDLVSKQLIENGDTAKALDYLEKGTRFADLFDEKEQTGSFQLRVGSMYRRAAEIYLEMNKFSRVDDRRALAAAWLNKIQPAETASHLLQLERLRLRLLDANYEVMAKDDQAAIRILSQITPLVATFLQNPVTAELDKLDLQLRYAVSLVSAGNRELAKAQLKNATQYFADISGLSPTDIYRISELWKSTSFELVDLQAEALARMATEQNVRFLQNTEDRNLASATWALQAALNRQETFELLDSDAEQPLGFHFLENTPQQQPNPFFNFVADSNRVPTATTVKPKKQVATRSAGNRKRPAMISGRQVPNLQVDNAAARKHLNVRKRTMRAAPRKAKAFSQSSQTEPGQSKK